MAERKPAQKATLVEAIKTPDGRLYLYHSAKTIQAYQATDGSLHLTEQEAVNRSKWIVAIEELDKFLEDQFCSSDNYRDAIKQTLCENAKVLATMLKDIADGSKKGT